MTVACLGEALIDLVPPLGHSPDTADYLAIQPGGAPLNIAVGLARLGNTALFLGRLSEDAFGRRLAQLLENSGVRRMPAGLVESPTRLAVVDHLNAASPFRFYGNATADTRLKEADVDAALAGAAIEGLYVSSLMMTDPIAGSVQEYAIKTARNRGVPVFSDPNPRPAAWASQAAMDAATDYLLSHSTLAKLSLDDARALAWPGQPDELLRWCAERFDAQIFLTGGDQGCWTLADGVVLHVPAPAVDVKDPTGAGDASFAALIFQFLSQGAVGVPELRFAAAAGALATQKVGAIAGLPTGAEVRELIAQTSAA